MPWCTKAPGRDMSSRYFCNRSQVQGSTFRVKDKEGIKDPKFSQKMLISQIITNLAPNFGFGLLKLMLFS